MERQHEGARSNFESGKTQKVVAPTTTSSAIVLFQPHRGGTSQSVVDAIPYEHRPENINDGKNINWNDYQMEREIGRGNNGVVYEYADNTSRDKHSVAARFSLYNDTRAKRYYENQLKVYSGFSSNFIPKFIGAEPSRYAFIYEFVPLRSMACALEGRTCSTNLIQRLVSQVVVALQEFHQQGFRHNDMHTGNILIGPSHILLVDFDKSRHVNNSSSDTERDWRFFGDHILKLLISSSETECPLLNDLKQKISENPCFRTYEFVSRHLYFETTDWNAVDIVTPLGISDPEQ